MKFASNGGSIRGRLDQYSLDGLVAQEWVTSSCQVGDAHGGELCRLGAAWWASPGVRACDTANGSLGVCSGAAGASPATRSIAANAVAAALDERTAWILGAAGLERWTISAEPNGLAVDRLQRSPVTGKAIDVAAAYGEALVATNRGVSVARAIPNGFTLTAPTELCGRPLAVMSLTASRWVVATTLGVALVDTAGGDGPTIVGAWSLAPDASGSLTPVATGTDKATAKMCVGLDAAFGAGPSKWRGQAILSRVSAERVLLARGFFLLDWSLAAGSLQVKRLTSLSQPVRSMRVDDGGTRAYAVLGALPWRETSRPIFDLRNGVEPAGQHQLTGWVERRDGTGIS